MSFVSPTVFCILYGFLCTMFVQTPIGTCEQFCDVVLKQGPIRGYKLDKDNLFSFYGIPYATAPKGEDKFKAAQSPPTWTELRNATDKDISCPQKDEAYGTRKLDCLVLNVFVPVTKEKDLPVLVYIHGGAVKYGSGRQMIPTTGLVDHGMIVVTLNYRIGAYGFLCLNTELAPGNAGLKDQVLALRWVKENIERFGGDPENISIGGSSAGGASAELHIVSPMSTGLFNKAVSEGGSAIGSGVVNLDHLKIAEDFANMFGVYTNKNVTALEEFYKSLTEEQLYADLDTDIVGFAVCLENGTDSKIDHFLTEPPVEKLRKRQFHKVKYMAGFTPQEAVGLLGFYESRKNDMKSDFSTFLPNNIDFKSKQHREESARRVKDFYFPTEEITLSGYLDFYSDHYFSYGSYVMARLQAEYNPAYIYLFTYNGTVNLPGFYELQKQFNYPLFPGHVPQSLYLQRYYIDSIYDNLNSNDTMMIKKLQRLYYNFFKYGDPTPVLDKTLDEVKWLPVTNETVHYLEVNTKLKRAQWPLHERFELWNDIYAFDFSNISVSDEENSMSKTISFLMILMTCLCIFLTLKYFF